MLFKMPHYSTRRFSAPLHHTNSVKHLTSAQYCQSMAWYLQSMPYMVGPRQNCNKTFLYRITVSSTRSLKPQKKNPPKFTSWNLPQLLAEWIFSMLFWTPQGNALSQKTFCCIFVLGFNNWTMLATLLSDIKHLSTS